MTNSHISKAHYDIYLFEELWMQPDHTTVAAKGGNLNKTLFRIIFRASAYLMLNIFQLKSTEFPYRFPRVIT